MFVLTTAQGTFQIKWFTPSFLKDVFSTGYFLIKDTPVNFNDYFEISKLDSTKIKLTFRSKQKSDCTKSIVFLNRFLKDHPTIHIVGMEIEIPTHPKMVRVYGEKFYSVNFFNEKVNRWSYLDKMIDGVVPFRYAQQLSIIQDGERLVQNGNNPVKVKIETKVIRSLVLG